jgi:hypothetical protein
MESKERRAAGSGQSIAGTRRKADALTLPLLRLSQLVTRQGGGEIDVWFFADTLWEPESA